MKANKEIRVYGTLLNHTLDANKSNGTKGVDNDFHNDALAYAYQLYDGRFFPNQDTIENYQDMINKRLSAISYADTNGGVTTISNRNGSKGNPYVLVVDGNTNIKGNLYIDGDLYYKDGDVYKPVDLSDIINRLDALEAGMLWEINGEGRVQAKNGRAAVAHGFYDSEMAS